MADLAITAANVLKSATASQADAVAGEEMDAGTPIYLDASDGNKAKKADANASAAAAACVGITVNKAFTGQPIRYLTSDDDFTHGLTGVAAGDVLILSATAGRIAPVADLASGWFPTVLMVAKSATKAHLAITRGSVAKA